VANLSPIRVKITGIAPAPVAADALGDSLPAGNTFALVKNSSAGSINVTVVVPGTTRFEQDEPDVVVAVPAGGERLIGPLSPALANAETGLVDLTYSAVASVTVAALAL
jgi:hypothetical protein